MKEETLKNILASHGLKVSKQRLMILQLLTSTDTHPTADEIYRKINAVSPVTSRATVYNTIHRLIQEGVLTSLDFGDNQSRYDFAEEPHGHFICKRCQTIYNVPMMKAYDAKDLPGFKVEDESLTLQGICPTCLSKEEN